MKRFTSIFLTVIINLFLYNRQGFSFDQNLKYNINVRFYDRKSTLDIINNSDNFPVTINANCVKGNYPNNIIFNGNVEIAYGNSHLESERVQLLQQQLKNTDNFICTVNIFNNICYYDNQIILKGQKGLLNLNNKDINIWKGSYQIVGHQGHGKADVIKQRKKNRYTILKNGSFTSCTLNSDIWSIFGSKLVHDHKEKIIKVWNARFKFRSIPIFYIPYLQLPIGNQNRSGFLIPSFKYSKLNYLEFCFPYYFSVSSNTDVTITPHYIHKYNNIILENEFRYINHIGKGLIEFDYLPSGKFLKKCKYKKKNYPHRWLFHWRHAGVSDKIWHFNMNYTKASDSRYFDDFNSKYKFITDKYNKQIFCINYSKRKINANALIKKFQIFNYKKSNNYIAEPQLNFQWYSNSFGPFKLHVYSQATRFVNINFHMMESMRLHLEPRINIKWINSLTNMNAEIKLMTTHYRQKNIINEHRNLYKEKCRVNLQSSSINRILPQLKIEAKKILERNINSKKGYVNILEPRIQYLYVPYRDQRKIQNHDSLFLHQFNYSDLFLDHTYDGLDRITPANKVTMGITTRIYNKSLVERFSFSIGKIHHFTKFPVNVDDIEWSENNKKEPFILVSDTYWHITNRWELHGNFHYDMHLNNITIGNGAIDYHHNRKNLIKLNYHYFNPNYTQKKSLNSINDTCYQKKNFQLDVIANWMLSNHLFVESAYHFTNNERKSINWTIGLQYSSCCHEIQLNYKQKLNTLDKNNQIKNENTIGFNIKLLGLTSKNINS